MDIEIIDYYNGIANRYDETRFGNSYGKYIDKQERMILNNLLGNQTKGLVLEIGCGTGRLLDYSDYGIDMSEEMVKVAKTKFPGKNIEVVDATDTSFKDNSFDSIISFHVFMHLDKITVKDILNESYRILKTDGRIIFDVPSEKRRELINYKSTLWHGANSYSKKDIVLLCENKWEIKKYYGIMFLPIHRVHKFFRKYLFFLDYLLCKSFFKEYSSYIIYELRKI